MRYAFCFVFLFVFFLGGGGSESSCRLTLRPSWDKVSVSPYSLILLIEPNSKQKPKQKWIIALMLFNATEANIGW